MGIFDKIREGLKKTRDNISGQITQMVNSFTKIDEELFEELEELLVMGDVGVNTAGLHLRPAAAARSRRRASPTPA